MIETLPLVLTGLGLAASIIYYANILNNANKTQHLQLETRQAQLFMQIYDRFTSVDFMKNFNIAMKKISWENFADYTNKYNTEANQETQSIVSSILLFFEGVGVLVEDDLIDSEVVAKLMAGNIIAFWEKFGSLILEARKVSGKPRSFDKTEYLYNELKRIRGEDW